MINAYLTDSVTLKASTADSWGTKTYVSTTVKGRFEFRTKLMRDLKGEQIVSTAKLFLPATTTVKHGDRIVYSGTEYAVIGIEKPKDFTVRFIKLDLA